MNIRAMVLLLVSVVVGWHCQRSVMQAPVVVKDSSETLVDGDAISICDLPSAEYPGGCSGWRAYLQENLRYPEDAVNANIEGRVMVQFTIDRLGNVRDVEAVSGPEVGGLREEAVRVIRGSGRWHPIWLDGELPRMYKRQPIVFRLTE